jgi:phage gp36-like protein
VAALLAGQPKQRTIMAYATQDDIITLYSEDALYVADRDGDGVVDADAVTRALTSASGEIDSYIGVRYSLPLETAPELLKQFCVDIAIYRLALSRDVLSEEHRRRYEDTIKHLDKIAKGTASLNLPGPVDPDTGETTQTSPRPIVAGGPAREFTREKMRGL